MPDHHLFNAVRQALLSNGFDPVKSKSGGHYKFRKESRKVTVPHKLHDRGMARTILRNQAGIDPKGYVP